MYRSFFFWGLLSLFLSSCQKANDIESQTSRPVEVKVKDVKTILFPQTVESLASCKKEIQTSGAKLLYENEQGLLMTDLEAQKLSPSCHALENERLEAPTPPKDGLKSKDLSNAPFKSLLDLLPAEDMQARTFIQDHPEFDGRGVVVGIVDTGIELDHPMLKTTSTGLPKVIAFADFSGEGRVEVSPVEVSTQETFEGFDDQTYNIQGLGGQDYKFGIFRGTSLNQGTDVSQSDQFEDVGVLVYSKGEGFFARIDTDNDLDFSNEIELQPLEKEITFTKLGEKKSLTTSIQINWDENLAHLAFDDGSHGTHVAGIAAGFDEQGLIGVAPGAQIVASKIGDSRLSGGSTTLASKMLGIDYVVSQGAEIVNISYGIRAGSNLGRSLIDQYIDKISKEKDVLFSISAGNEGPEMLSIGTPAGSKYAMTVGAYVSKDTARENYGYTAFHADSVWWFSSVGPLLNGSLKPTLIAPGAALSSLPAFSSGYDTYRGTSMAAPQATGAAALVLSAAKNQNLKAGRARLMKALQSGTRHIEGLGLIEQGHGLIQVPQAFDHLRASQPHPPLEYSIQVAGPTSQPTGSGIYYRSSKPPENLFRVIVESNLDDFVPGPRLQTFDLKPSQSWIETPSSFWLSEDPRSFLVKISPQRFKTPGLYSESIEAFDRESGELAFTIPVTLIVPHQLDPTQGRVTFNQVIEVGQTKRQFIEIPPGTSGIQLELETDGPFVYAQVSDHEGREITQLSAGSTDLPQPRLHGFVKIHTPGVYEVDLISRGFNPRKANVKLHISAPQIQIDFGPFTTLHTQEFSVRNNGPALQFAIDVELSHYAKTENLAFKNHKYLFPLIWSEADQEKYTGLEIGTRTSKTFYDQMTDFPYRFICQDGTIQTSGGLEWVGDIMVSQPCVGKNVLEIQGAFVKEAPEKWGMVLEIKKPLKKRTPVFKKARVLLEKHQFFQNEYVLSQQNTEAEPGLSPCVTMTLKDLQGRVLDEKIKCLP